MEHPQNILDRMTTGRTLVATWYNSHRQLPPNPDKIDTEDVYVVWFCKTLQNWKALLSTTVDDGRYYEATYNGDKGELYLDVYVKHDNVIITEELVGGHFEDHGFHTVERPGHETQVIKTEHWVPESTPATTSAWEFDKQGEPKPFSKAPGGDWDMHPDDVDPENAGIHGVKGMQWGHNSSDKDA